MAHAMRKTIWKDCSLRGDAAGVSEITDDAFKTRVDKRNSGTVD